MKSIVTRCHEGMGNRLNPGGAASERFEEQEMRSLSFSRHICRQDIDHMFDVRTPELVWKAQKAQQRRSSQHFSGTVGSSNPCCLGDETTMKKSPAIFRFPGTENHDKGEVSEEGPSYSLRKPPPRRLGCFRGSSASSSTLRKFRG